MVRRIISSLLILFYALLDQVSGAYAADGVLSQLPTRSECIEGFHLDWQSVRTDRADVANEMVWPTGENSIEEIVASRISLDLSKMYLMFKSDCDRKSAMSETLIEHWKQEGLDLPRFIRIDGPIVPSPGTIDARGPFWRDGFDPGLPLENLNQAPTET